MKCYPSPVNKTIAETQGLFISDSRCMEAPRLSRSGRKWPASSNDITLRFIPFTYACHHFLFQNKKWEWRWTYGNTTHPPSCNPHFSMQLRWCWPSLPPSPYRLKFFQIPSIFLGSPCHSQEITLSWNSHNSKSPPLSVGERADLFFNGFTLPFRERWKRNNTQRMTQ